MSPGVSSQVPRWSSFSQHEERDPSDTVEVYLPHYIQRRNARRVGGSTVASAPKLSASSPSACRVSRKGA